MCTAASYSTKQHYFGRNLDLEYSYHEEVTITPRNFPFAYRKVPAQPTHYALIGMAFIAGGYPLYYDAANEKGLGMAGLGEKLQNELGIPVLDPAPIAVQYAQTLVKLGLSQSRIAFPVPPEKARV